MELLVYDWSPMLSISLLHATYMSAFTPLEHRERWLSAASAPERVEYVVAMNDSDSQVITNTATIKCAINRAVDNYSTAVQNWNSAAELATGDVLFVISDDLTPSAEWDQRLEDFLGESDPVTQDFAVKIQDSPDESDTTLRHPIVSRKFYDTRGLFDGEFRGVFCDNDITLRAYLHSKILDGRGIQFSHAHPHFDRDVVESESHRKIIRPEEYDFGRSVFHSKYSPFHRGLNLNRLPLPTGLEGHRLGIVGRRAGIAAKRTLFKN